MGRGGVRAETVGFVSVRAPVKWNSEMSVEDLRLVLAVYRQCKEDAALLRERWEEHTGVWAGSGRVRARRDERQLRLALD